MCSPDAEEPTILTTSSVTSVGTMNQFLPTSPLLDANIHHLATNPYKKQMIASL